MARRYWAELKGKAALKMALEEVLEAWSISCRLEPVSVLNGKTMSPKHGSGSHGGGEIPCKLELSDRPSQPFTENRNRPVPAVNEAPARRDCENNGEAPSAGTHSSTGVSPRISKEDNDARRGTDGTRSDGNDTLQILSFPPEPTPGSRNTRRERSSLLQIVGFSVEPDRSSGTARMALVSEWPGVGSLHDLLGRKAGSVSASSQENLLRWTRQVAEGLVQTCGNSSCGGGGGGGVAGATLRVSARNVYLFRRPKDDFQDDRTVILDAKVRGGLRLDSGIGCDERLLLTFRAPETNNKQICWCLWRGAFA